MLSSEACSDPAFELTPVLSVASSRELTPAVPVVGSLSLLVLVPRGVVAAPEPPFAEAARAFAVRTVIPRVRIVVSGLPLAPVVVTRLPAGSV